MPHDAFTLTLADGTRLALCAGDETAAPAVEFWARTARLSPAPTPLAPDVCRISVVTAQRAGASRLASVGDGVCVSVLAGTPLIHQLVRLSGCIARETLPRGGVLLHSGLALLPSPAGREAGGEGGVLLAGRSGAGKSTACRRLPPPWRALSDDATLVVRDEQGAYWAHPFPTWSRFFSPAVGSSRSPDRGDSAGRGQEAAPIEGRDTWAVQQAAPLRAIFVLEQGEEDRAEPLEPGHALVLLANLARHTSVHLLRGRPVGKIAAFNLQRFENLCALVRAVPVYTLRVSRTGAFWEEIARVLG